MNPHNEKYSLNGKEPAILLLYHTNALQASIICFFPLI